VELVQQNQISSFLSYDIFFLSTS